MTQIDMEHVLTTYIRTKTVFKNRLKDLKNYSSVKVYVYELEKLGANKGPLLYMLRENGEIWYDAKGNFKAMRDGPIDLDLLNLTKKRVREKAVLTPLHEWMRDQLLHVELTSDAVEIPVYFKTFLDERHQQLDMFFTVDAFSGRVHSPVVNLKAELREGLRFYGSPLVSLDVKQMQPTILAKVLFNGVGKNDFTDSIEKGEDVYVLLQRSAKLPLRSDAKKLLFQLIFGKPKEGIGKLFDGRHHWVEWINDYKSREESRNPHKQDKHTNLAWLLQYNEVQVMTCIWQRLRSANIPFLTIHDDVLCREVDQEKVYKIMNDELKNHFVNFEVTITTH